MLGLIASALAGWGGRSAWPISSLVVFSAVSLPFSFLTAQPIPAVHSVLDGRPGAAFASARVPRPSPGGAGRAAASPVQVGRWQKPRSGWLYVLDPEAGSAESSQVLLVDPERGDIKGVIRAGYDPDMGLSPDGTRLYITSGAPGLLSVVDTVNGKVLETVEATDRSAYKEIPPWSSLLVSSDGRRLYVTNHPWTRQGLDKYAVTITTFDTVNGRFAKGEAVLCRCGYAHFLPALTDSRLAVHCPETNDVRFLRPDSSGVLVQESVTMLPQGAGSSSVRASAASISADGGALLALMPDGKVFQVEIGTGRVSPTQARGQPGRNVSDHTLVRSPDGRRLYVGLRFLANGGRPGFGSADQVRILDTTTWGEVGAYWTTLPFWSLAASRDGRTIYALSPDAASLLVLDTAHLDWYRTIKGIGNTPALAEVAP